MIELNQQEINEVSGGIVCEILAGAALTVIVVSFIAQFFRWLTGPCCRKETTPLLVDGNDTGYDLEVTYEAI